MKKAKIEVPRGKWEATLHNIRAMKKVIANLNKRLRKLEKNNA